MIVYPLTVIYLILLYNVRLFNNSPAVVVLISRLMHRVMSIVPSHHRYKIYVHVKNQNLKQKF